MSAGTGFNQSGGSGGGGGTVMSVNSGTDITVDNTDPANPIVNFTGTPYVAPIQVANYSALPAAGTAPGQTYIVLASQGTKWLPGSLGGTYYGKGYYYDNGTSYTYSEVPYNASQVTVDAGTNSTEFVTADTFTNATKWTTKQNILSGTGIVKSTAGTISYINGTSAQFVKGDGSLDSTTYISGLTVGTTVISSGSTTRILYNNAGVLGEYTITGSGTVVAMQTSPSFLTSTTLTLTDAVTNAATTVQTVVHNSSGSIAANFGLSKLIQLQSTTTTSRDAGKESWSWETATDATRSSRYSLSLVSSGGALTEYYRFGATGIVEMYGSAPQFQFAPGGTLRNIISWINPSLRISAQESPFSQILVYKDKVVINNDGSGVNKLGLNNTSPTAQIHPAAGTATANTAPLKFTSGTNLTTAEAGAMEYNGTNLFFTRSGTTREGVLTQSAVTTEVVVSDTTVTVNINGTTYKLLARA